MLELELLEGCEGAVALLEKAQALPLLLTLVSEAVVGGDRLTEKRPRDEDDARDGEESGQDERGRLHLGGRVAGCIGAEAPGQPALLAGIRPHGDE